MSKEKKEEKQEQAQNPLEDRIRWLTDITDEDIEWVTKERGLIALIVECSDNILVKHQVGWVLGYLYGKYNLTKEFGKRIGLFWAEPSKAEKKEEEKSLLHYLAQLNEIEDIKSGKIAKKPDIILP